LVGQAVLARRSQRAGDELAVRGAELDDAGDLEQRFARLALERTPQRDRGAHQRHVGRMLEVAEPDDAGLAVRRAAVVAGRELFDADRAHAAPGEMVKRGAAHGAEPDHRNVETAHVFPFTGTATLSRNL